MLSVRACARGLNLVVLWLCTSELIDLLLEESASPFIDDGDGLTSERERVRMLLSLVAHAQRVQDDGRRPQYCLMSDARGRLRRLLQVWQTSVPAILLIP